MFGGLGELLVGLIVLVVIFLVCRELVTWYWKLNEILSMLKDAHNELRGIHDELRIANGKAPVNFPNKAISADGQLGSKIK